MATRAGDPGYPLAIGEHVDSVRGVLVVPRFCHHEVGTHAETLPQLCTSQELTRIRPDMAHRSSWST